jgi:hypothetical protein
MTTSSLLNFANTREEGITSILNHLLRNGIPFLFQYLFEFFEVWDESMAIHSFLQYTSNRKIERIKIGTGSRNFRDRNEMGKVFLQMVLETS